MPIKFLVLILALIPLTFFIEAFWLWLTTKILKVENATYKKALKVSTIFLLVGMVLEIIVAGMVFFMNKDAYILGIGTSVIVGFFIANFLYKKYYFTESKKNIWIYIVKSIFGSFFGPMFLGLLIIFPIRTYLVQPFFMQGAGMEPTVVDGQYMLFNEYDKTYQREDIIVFRYPKNEKQFFLKRIIGLPGEKIEIRDSAVYVNEKILDESQYLSSNVKTIGNLNIYLASDEYFVMGDNRDFSSDSRSWGPVRKNLIIGKYWATLYK